MRRWGWLVLLFTLFLMATYSRPVVAADITVPTAIPEGFDQPSAVDNSAPSRFRTQPNWNAYGYILGRALGVPPQEEPYQEELSQEALSQKEMGELADAMADVYHYAIVANDQTLPLKASFDKYGEYYTHGVQIHVRHAQGATAPQLTSGKLGIDDSAGIHSRFDDVGWGEDYDYIGYDLTFAAVTVPTWFRYQIEIEIEHDRDGDGVNDKFYSDIFPVLVVPVNWQPRLTADSQVLLNVQAATVGIAGMEAIIQPQYSWEQAPPSVQPTGNMLTVSNTAAVTQATLAASLTIPAHPQFQAQPVTYTAPPLPLYFGRLADQTVALGGVADFEVGLPADLTVVDAQWRQDALAIVGTQTTLRLAGVESAHTIFWTAMVETASGIDLSASGQAALWVTYTDALTMTLTAGTPLMVQTTTTPRAPTVKELLAGAFAGTTAPSTLPPPQQIGPWLVTRDLGQVQVVDSRNEIGRPWTLAVRLTHFETAQSALSGEQLTLFMAAQPFQLVAGGGDTIVATANGTRLRQWALAGVLRVPKTPAPLAGTYRAQIVWTLAFAPSG